MSPLHESHDERPPQANVGPEACILNPFSKNPQLNHGKSLY